MSYQLPGIKNKVVIVTGHKTGIGAATFKHLQEQGAHVYGFDLPEINLVKIESIQSHVKAIADSAGCIDVLVNNAGLAVGRDYFEEDREDSTGAGHLSLSPRHGLPQTR